MRILATVLALAQLMWVTGCGSGKAKGPKTKLPRPVSVLQLQLRSPDPMKRLTGAVESFKTEELGFEVSGRVRYVIEPESVVDGQVFTVTPGAKGTRPLRTARSPGDVLAELDPARYELAVKSVLAQIDTAMQQKKVAEIELGKVLPAERQAANADLVFRKAELKRNRPLFKSGAVTRAELDQFEADEAAAIAVLAKVDAQKLAKGAEVASLQAKADELKETLAQAKRDLADCKLRAPFRGQIAKVHAIPGSVVKAGQRVATLQMMDPIKIEVEVSAATSRRLNYRDVVNIWPPDGSDAKSSKPKTAFIYNLDPVADPVTRTFTVTLLLRNSEVRSAPPADWTGPVVRTRDVWEIMEPPKAMKLGDGYFVESNAVHSTGDQHYVWKVTNWDKVIDGTTDVLNVTKIKVIPADLRVDWLGIWTFRALKIAEGEDFDVDKDFVAGQLDSEGPLTGNKILMDRHRWELRPGDLVAVDLAGGRSPSGFYVPMNTIQKSGAKSFVFVVEDGRAKRIEVQVYPGPNTLKRIEALVSTELTPATKIIAGGVHYLTDGESVNVVKELQVKQ